MADDAWVLELDGRSVRVTSPDKVFFSSLGATKADLVRYYLAVGEPFLRAMRGRPTMLQRFPDGASGKSFFQKRVPAGAPDWLQTAIVSTPNGTTSNALVLADLAHVVWAVNLGCLGFHPWPSRADDLDHVDELRLDLDPQPGVAFDRVREAAAVTKELLDEVGVPAGAKSTASRGIHIYARLIPRWDAMQVRAAAVAIARELERRRPDLVTAAWWKEERGDRVFVDFNQNAPHKTVFGAWSARARVGGQVSTPFAWDELETIDPDALTIETVPGRVTESGDPWAGLLDGDDGATIEPFLAWSDRDLAAGLGDAPWPPVYPKMPGEPPRVAPSRAKKS